MRIVLSIDPAVSEDARADATALVVLGQAENNEIRCLEAIARRMRMPDLVNLIDDFDRRWNPEAILFESNAAFKGIEDLLVRHARFGYKIRGIAQSRSKAARVEAFSVQVQNGTFRLKSTSSGCVDPSQQAVRRDDDVSSRRATTCSTRRRRHGVPAQPARTAGVVVVRFIADILTHRLLQCRGGGYAMPLRAFRPPLDNVHSWDELQRLASGDCSQLIKMSRALFSAPSVHRGIDVTEAMAE
jgi:predicted phage terminase large subunit-like protein